MRKLTIALAAALTLGLSRVAYPADEDVATYTKRLEAIPQEFVVTWKSSDRVMFVDVGRVQILPDRTLGTNVYLAFEIGQPFYGKTARYISYLTQYNCEIGSIRLRAGTVFNDTFSMISMLQVPNTARPWIAAKDSEIAKAYGYDDLCKTASPPRQRIDKGKDWTVVAASLLAKLRAQ